MATALIARAREHADWIGDDHGDPYEEAMIAGNVDEKMQVVTKEICEHLRAALDYCARQVWQEISGAPLGAEFIFQLPVKAQNRKILAS